MEGRASQRNLKISLTTDLLLPPQRIRAWISPLLRNPRSSGLPKTGRTSTEHFNPKSLVSTHVSSAEGGHNCGRKAPRCWDSGISVGITQNQQCLTPNAIRLGPASWSGDLIVHEDTKHAHGVGPAGWPSLMLTSSVLQTREDIRAWMKRREVCHPSHQNTRKS